jgi:hypothetical protein
LVSRRCSRENLRRFPVASASALRWVAIVRNPKVSSSTNPLSNLDAKMRVQMRSEVFRLYAELAMQPFRGGKRVGLSWLILVRS